MVFSTEGKAVIKNDFIEKGWSPYRICKEHPTKNWNRVSVYRLLKRFKEEDSMDRKTGSGRPRTVTNVQNEELVEDSICSQEDNPGSHMSPREIEKNTGISRTSVRKMIKRRGLNQFKRLKTPRMSAGTKERRTNRAGALAERFSENARSIENCVWQDEKDFTVDIPLNSQNGRVYGVGCKASIVDNRLFHQSNKQSKMVSACVTWNGATKPFFVNEKGLKVNAKFYKKHLEKQLLPEVDNIMKNKRWIFIQHSAPSHRANIVQDFLKEKLHKRFVKHTERPQSSPDCNPLDYHFWNKIKEKVYGDRFNRSFENEKDLKKKIKKV